MPTVRAISSSSRSGSSLHPDEPDHVDQALDPRHRREVGRPRRAGRRRRPAGGASRVLERGAGGGDDGRIELRAGAGLELGQIAVWRDIAGR